jgi:hypothetical protein
MIRAGFWTGILLAGALGAAAAAPAARKGPAPGSLAALVGKVFDQEDVAVMLKNKTDGYRFEILDEKAGFARVVGPFGGHDDFFRLEGKAGATLIEIDYTCASTCRQKASVFRIGAGDAARRVRFTDVLDFGPFDDNAMRITKLCLDGDGNYEAEPQARAESHRELSACPFALSLSKRGGRGTLFSVENEDGSGYALSVGKTMLAPRTELRWNGSAYAGKTAKDQNPFLLNGDRLAELF